MLGDGFLFLVGVGGVGKVFIKGGRVEIIFWNKFLVLGKVWWENFDCFGWV